MTFSEWAQKEYGIEITKTQMPLPTMFKGYKEYCIENEIEENWEVVE